MLQRFFQREPRCVPQIFFWEIMLRGDLGVCIYTTFLVGGDPFITFAERGGRKIRPKCQRSKGGCVNLVLSFGSKCVQGEGESPKS